VFEAGANIKFEANMGGKYYANAPLETRSDIFFEGIVYIFSINKMKAHNCFEGEFLNIRQFVFKQWILPSISERVSKGAFA
jgi:hypothetical protein